MSALEIFEKNFKGTGLQPDIAAEGMIPDKVPVENICTNCDCCHCNCHCHCTGNCSS